MVVTHHCRLQMNSASACAALARLRPSSSFLNKPTRPLISQLPPSHQPQYTPVRYATHGAQGRANGPKNGPGKRLGAKKTGDQYVIPGNIIYRQRGTVWHAGANVGLGRDHTIFALESGYVKFYRDPRRHPTRKYIGVVFNKNDTLPAVPHAARKRRLNMLPVPRKDINMDALPSEMEEPNIGVAAVPTADSTTQNRFKSTLDRTRRVKGQIPISELKMRPDYSFRESNWSIGRAAERAGVTVPPYKPGDRFAAWRKRTVRKAKAAEKRSLGRKKPNVKKNKARKA